MKRTLVVLLLLLLSLGASTSFAELAAPNLSYATDGLTVTLNWTTIPDATGYMLNFAPYPYEGEETIETADMGANADLTVDLWEGAAYYIAMQAHSDTQSSEYSNIELVIIDSTGIVDNDGDGYTENQGDCDDGNSQIFTGAVEVCGNGIDEDCNGSDSVCEPIPLPPPTLTQTIQDKKVTMNWTTIPDATGYMLNFAPYPYEGPSTIESANMGTVTSFTADLSEGAAYYVALQSYNNTQSSEYSNIELVIIENTDNINGTVANRKIGMIWLNADR